MAGDTKSNADLGRGGIGPRGRRRSARNNPARPKPPPARNVAPAYKPPQRQADSGKGTGRGQRPTQRQGDVDKGAGIRRANRYKRTPKYRSEVRQNVKNLPAKQKRALRDRALDIANDPHRKATIEEKVALRRSQAVFKRMNREGLRNRKLSGPYAPQLATLARQGKSATDVFGTAREIERSKGIIRGTIKDAKEKPINKIIEGALDVSTGLALDIGSRGQAGSSLTSSIDVGLKGGGKLKGDKSGADSVRSKLKNTPIQTGGFNDVPGPELGRKVIKNVGAAWAQDKDGVTLKTAKGLTYDTAVGLAQAVGDAYSATASGHPEKAVYEVGEQAVQDYQRRYGPLLTGGKDGEDEFRQRIVREGAAGEVLDAAVVATAGGGVIGRAGGAIAKKRGLGPYKPSKFGGTGSERPNLRYSPGIVRRQKLSKNLFSAMYERRLDAYRYKRGEKETLKGDPVAQARARFDPEIGPINMAEGGEKGIRRGAMRVTSVTPRKAARDRAQRRMGVAGPGAVSRVRLRFEDRDIQRKVRQLYQKLNTKKEKRALVLAIESGAGPGSDPLTLQAYRGMIVSERQADSAFRLLVDRVDQLGITKRELRNVIDETRIDRASRIAADTETDPTKSVQLPENFFKELNEKIPGAELLLKGQRAFFNKQQRPGRKRRLESDALSRVDEILADQDAYLTPAVREVAEELRQIETDLVKNRDPGVVKNQATTRRILPQEAVLQIATRADELRRQAENGDRPTPPKGPPSRTVTPDMEKLGDYRNLTDDARVDAMIAEDFRSAAQDAREAGRVGEADSLERQAADVRGRTAPIRKRQSVDPALVSYDVGSEWVAAVKATQKTKEPEARAFLRSYLRDLERRAKGEGVKLVSIEKVLGESLMPSRTLSSVDVDTPAAGRAHMMDPSVKRIIPDEKAIRALPDEELNASYMEAERVAADETDYAQQRQLRLVGRVIAKEAERRGVKLTAWDVDSPLAAKPPPQLSRVPVTWKKGKGNVKLESGEYRIVDTGGSGKNKYGLQVGGVQKVHRVAATQKELKELAERLEATQQNIAALKRFDEAGGRSGPIVDQRAIDAKEADAALSAKAADEGRYEDMTEPFRGRAIAKMDDVQLGEELGRLRGGGSQNVRNYVRDLEAEVDRRKLGDVEDAFLGSPENTFTPDPLLGDIDSEFTLAPDSARILLEDYDAATWSKLQKNPSRDPRSNVTKGTKRGGLGIGESGMMVARGRKHFPEYQAYLEYDSPLVGNGAVEAFFAKFTDINITRLRKNVDEVMGTLRAELDTVDREGKAARKVIETPDPEPRAPEKLEADWSSEEFEGQGPPGEVPTFRRYTTPQGYHVEQYYDGGSFKEQPWTWRTPEGGYAKNVAGNGNFSTPGEAMRAADEFRKADTPGVTALRERLETLRKAMQGKGKVAREARREFGEVDEELRNIYKQRRGEDASSVYPGMSRAELEALAVQYLEAQQTATTARVRIAAEQKFEEVERALKDAPIAEPPIAKKSVAPKPKPKPEPEPAPETDLFGVPREKAPPDYGKGETNVEDPMFNAPQTMPGQTGFTDADLAPESPKPKQLDWVRHVDNQLLARDYSKGGIGGPILYKVDKVGKSRVVTRESDGSKVGTFDNANDAQRAAEQDAHIQELKRQEQPKKKKVLPSEPKPDGQGWAASLTDNQVKTETEFARDELAKATDDVVKGDYARRIESLEIEADRRGIESPGRASPDEQRARYNAETRLKQAQENYDRVMERGYGPDDRAGSAEASVIKGLAQAQSSLEKAGGPRAPRPTTEYLVDAIGKGSWAKTSRGGFKRGGIVIAPVGTAGKEWRVAVATKSPGSDYITVEAFKEWARTEAGMYPFPDALTARDAFKQFAAKMRASEQRRKAQDGRGPARPWDERDERPKMGGGSAPIKELTPGIKYRLYDDIDGEQIGELDTFDEALEAARAFTGDEELTLSGRKRVNDAGDEYSSWRGEGEQLAIGEDAPRKVRVEEETAQERADRVSSVGAGYGLSPGGYVWNRPTATARFSDHAVGGFGAIQGSKPYGGVLFRRGYQTLDPEVILQGFSRNIKRYWNWNLVARTLENIALQDANGRPMVNMRVLDALEMADEYEWAEGSYKLYNPGVFYREAADVMEEHEQDLLASAAIEREGDAATTPEVQALVADALKKSVKTPAQVRKWQNDSVAANSLDLKRTPDAEDFENSTGWSIVPTAAYEELESITRPDGKGWRIYDKVFKSIPSRLILFASTDWLQFQVASNALMATVGGVWNPTDYINARWKWWSKLDPEVKRAIEPWLGVTPLQRSQRMGSTLSAKNWVNQYRAMKELALNKKLISMRGRAITAADLNPIDRWFDLDKMQNSFFRKTVAYNTLKREALARMLTDMSAVAKAQERIMAQFRVSKDLQDLMLRMSKEPEVLEDMVRNVDNWMGDYLTWTAKERKGFERVFMFPGFLRFSVRLAFVTLPKEHPFLYSLALKIGQLKYQEVKYLLGGDELGYAMGRWIKSVNEQTGEVTSVNLSRANPLLNAATQGIGQGNAGALLGLFSPWVAAAGNQIYAKTAFSGKGFRVEGEPRERDVSKGEPEISAADRARIGVRQTLGMFRPYRAWEDIAFKGTPQGDDSLPFSKRPIKFLDPATIGDIERSRAREPSAGRALLQGAFPIGGTFDDRLADTAPLRDIVKRKKERRKAFERAAKNRKAGRSGKSPATKTQDLGGGTGGKGISGGGGYGSARLGG